MTTKKIVLAILALMFSRCSHETLPAYSKKGTLEDFLPIVQFMDYKPGMAFADVGAGSGAYTVLFTTFMDGSAVYIQDIDTAVLNKEDVDHILDYYSTKSHIDLRKKNNYHVSVGDVRHTNLPDAAFDRIFSNGTVHNFTEIDSIMTDIRAKLKPGGLAFFRDSFRGDHKEKEFCSDPKCGRPLLSIGEFLSIMKRNGFTMVKRSPDMSGYPVFGFSAN